MSDAFPINGSTRVLAIIGDPIAQVKSPAGLTQALRDRGVNAVVVPAHVSAVDVDAFIRGASLARNLDSIIVTVPHKFAAYRHCATATERAHFLGAVNALRRNPDGTWHGDMFDGVAFVDGVRSAGCMPQGRRALLVGAGGAGSAIALALLESGVTSIAIHDEDAVRRDALIARLRTRDAARVGMGSSDPTGFTLVVNATPAGMREADPLPVDVTRLSADMFVGDVITAPAITPLIAAARRAGCSTQIGTGMFAAVTTLIVAFLLQTGPLHEHARAPG